MLLTWLMNWQPFHIDALGLVTLLGAEQVNRALGCFVSNPIADHLPLLAAFVVAGDAFTEPIAGFRLLNITDGIQAYDVSPWFSRWLLMQKITWNSTCLSLQFIGNVRGRSWRFLPLAFGVVTIGVLFVVPSVMADWWGLANTVALAISVAVRRHLLGARAAGLRQQWYASSNEKWANEVVKCLVLTPAGHAITLLVPRGIVTEVMLSEPKVERRAVYDAARVLGWVAFGCHVISLGMASLVNQILTVFVLISSTCLTIHAVGTDYSQVARDLRIVRYDEKVEVERRSRVYIRLDLTSEEEDCLVLWSLMPPRWKQGWWTGYCKRKEDQRGSLGDWRIELEKMSSDRTSDEEAKL